MALARRLSSAMRELLYTNEINKITSVISSARPKPHIFRRLCRDDRDLLDPGVLCVACRAVSIAGPLLISQSGLPVQSA